MPYSTKLRRHVFCTITHEVVGALFLGLQKCYAPVWKWGTKPKKLPFQVKCPQRSFHLLKKRFAQNMPKNSIFSTSLTLSFWLVWPCSLTYRNVTHFFWIRGPSLKNSFFKLSVIRGLIYTLKCSFHKIWQNIVLFSFLGHLIGPKTTSHNKVVKMWYGGLVVLKITALSLNWYRIPV